MLEAATTEFAQGKFDEARRQCDAFLAVSPNHVEALVLAGRLALYANRLDDAQRLLTKVLQLIPDNAKAKTLLAEVYVRQDRFQDAAPLIPKVDTADRLRSFVGTTPYSIEGNAAATSLKMVLTDPLPVVRVRVNGGEEVDFLIDTGGAETVLDASLATALGVRDIGATQGTFAGGAQAAVGHGRIERLTLGGFTISNVPVSILDTTPFAVALSGHPVRGVIGTVLLYHFLATIDYPRGELILRRPTRENREQVDRDTRSGGGFEVPFWLAGDHYVLAWGSVNGSASLLFCVDTGLAGGGFVCPDSTLKEADIKVRNGQAVEGVGGGGTTQAVPFTLNALSLGGVRAQRINGLAGVFPPPLEHLFAFRIAGLISHEFFRPYAVTFDFQGMKLLMRKPTKTEIPR